MYEFRVFGQIVGEVTRGWTSVEAESLEAAATWPLVTIANTVEAPQKYHVVLRSSDREEQARADVFFDGERMDETWL